MIIPNFRLFSLALALLLGLSVSCQGAPLVAYVTLESAALDGLAEAQAIAPDHEAGGAIYQCGKVFAYTPVVTQKHKDRVFIPTGEVPECFLIALFHTHPKGDARLSAIDVRTTCDLKVRAFVQPKEGSMISFDCRTLSAPQIAAAVTRAKNGG